MSGLGAVRVDEVILPIQRLRLVPEGLEITATVRGPHESFEGHPRLFTAKGEPVTDRLGDPESVIRVARVRETDEVNLTWVIKFDNWAVQRGRKKKR